MANADRELDRLLIRGGHRLKGEVRLQGSRGAALAILAATMLARGRSIVRNLPRVGDVTAMRRLLETLGVACRGDDPVSIDTAGAEGNAIDYRAVRSLRAAVLLLGPLLARGGQARIALPGGSALGARPIDRHLRGLEAMGATIRIEHGDVVARARRLRGAMVACEAPTVGGTENLMMAAVLARGRTQIDNAARDPEVEELARLLNKMGGRVQGAGTSCIVVEGVEALTPVEHTVPPDRIEAGTLLVAAALTGGEVRLGGAVPEHLESVIARLRAAEVAVDVEAGAVRVHGPAQLQPIDVTTAPYPGFPTDLQPAFMVLAARAQGQSLITEMVFEARTAHAQELARMGADIHVEGRTVIVRGPARLSGARVGASDMHAAAALCLAGLVADAETELEPVAALDAGYDRFDLKLRALGADVVRVERAPSGGGARGRPRPDHPRAV